MNKGKVQWIGAIVFILIVFTACSANTDTNNDSQGGNNNESNETNGEEIAAENNNNEEDSGGGEPVTVTIGSGWFGDDLEALRPRLEEELPHINVEILELPHVDEDEFEDLIVAGEIPDIVSTLEQRRDFQTLREYELEFDFEHIIDQYNFDLGLYDPGIIESFRNATPTGGIVALPYASNYFAIHYNKGIFDQFGVEYPQDHLTWNEVVDLASDLTREEGSVQYYGLSFNEYLVPFIYSQFGENFIHPETGDVMIQDSDGFRRMVEMIERLKSIPGQIADGEEWFGASFFEDGTVAMDINWHELWRLNDGEVEGIDWDIAGFPMWEGFDGIGPEANASAWAITSTAEHPEEAFEVVAFITSEEATQARTQAGNPTALAAEDVRAQFGANLEGIEDYNIEALWALEPSAGAPEISRYESTAPLRELIVEYATDTDRDVQEYLRYAEEVIEEHVREQQAIE